MNCNVPVLDEFLFKKYFIINKALEKDRDIDDTR
jgi:hypothetical protein